MIPLKPEASLRERIKLYKKRMREIEAHLSDKPDDWGRYQSEFNQEINGIFRELMIFEKESIASGHEDKLYRFKQFFRDNFQKEFVRGEYIAWSLNKPYGYAGDFQIIDHIYHNHPKTKGVERLFDNYFLMSPASVATRNRKEDFKRILHEFISGRPNEEILVMDLASGPSRDLFEFFRDCRDVSSKTKFICYENDDKAIEFSKKLLKNENVSFVKENVVRIALKKNIQESITQKFDFIFSTGLFDYLDMKLGTRLISNLKKLLNPNGVMVISNYRDKYSNPSINFMELVGEWNLVYRTEEEFMEMFVASGFEKSQLSFQYEQQGIMQYCFAKLPRD